MSLKLNLDQVAGLAAELANNTAFVAAISAALANTNANVASVSGIVGGHTVAIGDLDSSITATASSLANTNANVASVSNSVTFMDGGYENVANVPIQANGLVYIDMAAIGTAVEILLNRNITGFIFLNPPPMGVRKSYTLTIKGMGTGYTASWGSNVAHNGGSAPSLNTTNGKTNVFTQVTTNSAVTVWNLKGGEV